MPLRRGYTIWIVLTSIITTILFCSIVSIGKLAPVNDHILLMTLMSGRKFIGYSSKALGRFMPLTGFEYTIYSSLLGPSSFGFYLVHGLILGVSLALLAYAMRMSRISGVLSIALWTAVAGSLAFGTSANILQATELNQLMFSNAAAVCMLIARARIENGEQRSFLPQVAVLLLTLNLLYKETAFAMSLAFGALELVRARMEGRRIESFAVGAVVTGLAYLAFYAWWHGASLQGTYAEAHALKSSDVLTFNASNDPFIVFVALPIAVIRFILVVSGKLRLTLFDSFLGAALAYDATFVLLRMSSAYYFLPSYGLAAIGIGGLVKKASYRRLIAGASILLTLNNIPIYVADNISARNISQNYNRFIEVISSYVKERGSKSDPVHLVLLGADEASQLEIFQSMRRFLSYAGVSPESYALESDRDLRIGDVAVYNPYQKELRWPTVLSPSEGRIYQSDGEHAPPRWTLWGWANVCLPSFICRETVDGNSPYTGYAARTIVASTLLDRDPQPVKGRSYEIKAAPLPANLSAGASYSTSVLVRNTGTDAWPSDGTARAGKFVHMSYVWRSSNGSVIQEGQRFALPESIGPGQSFELPMLIRVPYIDGDFELVLCPVQENVAWFCDGGVAQPGAAMSLHIHRTIFGRIETRIAAALK